MNYSIPLENVCKTLVTERLIKYIAAKAASVIQCSPPPATLLSGRAITPPPTPNSPGTSSYACPYPPKMEEHIAQVPLLPIFISNVVERSRAQTPTLLSTLVYLDRLQRRLPKAAKGMPCTCHRVFLAALILAAKYTNDSSPKNKHWARYSSVFSLPEVNLMEKQLLFLLDFDLKIHESQLIAQIRPFFGQDIVHPAPMAMRPVLPDLSLTVGDIPIHPKQRSQPSVPEPHHHRPLPTLSSLSDFRRVPTSSSRDRGINLHGKLARPSEHNNNASFYPSPSHSDTTADGGSRRSSISDPNTSLDVGPTAALVVNGDGSMPTAAYCYRNYQKVVADGCIAVSDALQNHGYYHHHHVQPHHVLTGGAIC